ncbi:MAG: FecR domain-containing protein [Bacteroidales bacterium]|nr:FecR domain-containing protein [Bacteroidales bacterium]
MEQEKIVKLIANELDPNEREEILNEIYNSKELRETYYELLNLHALLGSTKPHKRVSEYELRNYLEEISRRKFKRILHHTRLILKYAAFLAIAFILGRTIDFTGDKKQLVFNEVIVPKGQMSILTLHDGTVVYLNSSTRLRYPVNFSKEERKVYLLEGEAYLKVAHNKQKPFMVVVREHEIKVLGTTFNVCAYDSSLQVTLVEGKIALCDSSGSVLAKLTPGLQFTQRGKTGYYISRVDTTEYISWREGMYRFHKDTLSHMVAKIERIYDVKIELDEQIKNYRFSGTILKSMSVEQFLKILKLTANIDYAIKVDNKGNKTIYLKSRKEMKTKT